MSYEGVHARPDGQSTPSRMALTASEYGFDGVVIRNHGDSPATYDPAHLREKYAIDVVPAVEIRVETPSQASGFVGAHRTDQTLVCVHGGTPAINRFAVEQVAVDVLAHPMAGSGDFNHVLAKSARDNGVRVELSFRDVLRASGGRRVRAIAALRKLWELLDTYDVPYVVSADPVSHLQLRAPRELKAVGEQIGLSDEIVATGLTEWGRLTERNRTRRSETFVEPGVWRVDEP